jgi:tight adherence protein B
MIVTVALFFVATFGMIAAGVIGYRFLMERRALEGAAGHREEGGVSWFDPADLLKSDSLSSISFWDKLLTRIDYVEIMKVQITESGLNWTVGRLTLLMLLAGAATYGVLSNLSAPPWWMCVGGACFVAGLPYNYVLQRRRKRLIKIEVQFPDGLDSLARALRAGHPLVAGLQMLALEAPEPLASEMHITVRERTLGLPWDQALDNLSKRVPIVEVTTFVAAVKLQNRTGGKLSEVLGRLSETMRESAALKGEVRAISAHGKMTGLVLTILPLGIAAVMMVVNPTHMMLLWTRPAGQQMIGAGAVCLLLAYFVIKKMVDIRI